MRAATSFAASGTEAPRASASPADPVRRADQSGPSWVASSVPQPALPPTHVNPSSDSLAAATCPSPGNCLAVGKMQWGAQPQQPIVDEELNGRWSSTAIPWPLNGDDQLHLGAVSNVASCASPGNCAVAVSVTTSSTGAENSYTTVAFLVESDGTWSLVQSSIQAPALDDVGVTAVGCPVNGTCFFTFALQRGGPNSLYELHGGSVSPVSIDLPAGMSASSLGPLTCTEFGTCAAIGAVSSGSTSSPAIFTYQEASWTGAPAPLPANLPTSGNMTLQTVSCDPTGTCTAFGTDPLPDGTSPGIIETGSGSSWSSAVALSPTSLPESAPSVVGMTFSWSSCPGVAECLAGGMVTGVAGGHNFSDPLTVEMDGGPWRATDVGPTGTSPFWPTEMSCSSMSNCAGITPNSGVDVIVGGANSQWMWTRVSNPDPIPGAALVSMVCGGGGPCVAVGNTRWVMMEQHDTPGGWQWQDPPAPLVDTNPQASMDSVSCASASFCAGAGVTQLGGITEVGGSDGYLVLYAKLGGAWKSTLAPLPDGGQPYPPAVTCAPDGSGCVVADTYVPSTGSDIEGFIATLSGGSWSYALAPVPSDAAAKSDVWLSRPSCPTVSSCVIVGGYERDVPWTATNRFGVMASTNASGSWQAQAAPSPGCIQGDCPQLGAVSCPVPGWCAALGTSFIDVLSDGVWTTVPTPAGSVGGGPSISCWAVDECLAPWVYDSGGSWQSIPGTSQDPASTLSCDGSGDCVATKLPNILSDSAGGSFSVNSSTNIDPLAASSCAPDGGCAIIGSGWWQQKASGGMIATGTPGSQWQDAEVPPLSNTTYGPVLNDVSCLSGLGCLGVGTEGDNFFDGLTGLGPATTLVETPGSVSQDTPAMSVSMATPTVQADHPLAVTANVSGDSGVPTGYVTFSVREPTDGSATVCGSVPVNSSGEASCSIRPGSHLLVGAHTLLATYSGDSNYSGVTTTQSYTVTPAPPPAAESTTIQIAGLPRHRLLLTPHTRIKLSVSVSPRNAGPQPSGTFSAGELCSAALSGGRAACTVTRSAIQPGRIDPSIVYYGDQHYAPTAIREHSFRAILPKSKLALSASPSKAASGARIVLKLRASGKFGHPTGAVTWPAGTCSRHTSLNHRGVARCSFTLNHKPGKVHWVAAYLGSSTYRHGKASVRFTVS